MDRHVITDAYAAERVTLAPLIISARRDNSVGDRSSSTERPERAVLHKGTPLAAGIFKLQREVYPQTWGPDASKLRTKSMV